MAKFLEIIPMRHTKLHNFIYTYIVNGLILQDIVNKSSIQLFAFNLNICLHWPQFDTYSSIVHIIRRKKCIRLALISMSASAYEKVDNNLVQKFFLQIMKRADITCLNSC